MKDLLFNEYVNCPLCGDQLSFQAKTISDKDYNVQFYPKDNIIVIDVISNNYINPDISWYRFSIIIDENGIHSYDDELNFLSIYSTNIYIYKQCSNCLSSGDTFLQIYSLYYDRLNTEFVLEKVSESLGLTDGDLYYIFMKPSSASNCYIYTKSSDAGIQMDSVITLPIKFKDIISTNKNKILAKFKTFKLLV
jgi:hypothetical protein